MRPVAISLLAALVVAACNEDLAPSNTPPTHSPELISSADAKPDGLMLECVDAIDNAAEVPTEYQAILGSVALPTSESATHALQAVQRPDEPPPNYFAKTGLLLRANAPMSIEVEHASQGALIGWGSPPAFSSRVWTDGCAGTGWFAFPGGLMVAEPMCLNLTVTVDADSETIHLGAGAACNGQQPPPSP
ncbi:hypothetical protein [Ornithinimicrobium avium]|uniref:Uncharacterized protein n=1 Tax=Ornithinimicrobium avium TaxID=2283195 RepID=A0A345NPI8_9MICO|nr:hypothetical protein [Ornithinimicrobium avium]AXH96946.1 hypothetical protein DV701_13190 [Ornithinimicrobium avium]